MGARYGQREKRKRKDKSEFLVHAHGLRKTQKNLLLGIVVLGFDFSSLSSSPVPKPSSNSRISTSSGLGKRKQNLQFKVMVQLFLSVRDLCFLLVNWRKESDNVSLRRSYLMESLLCSSTTLVSPKLSNYKQYLPLQLPPNRPCLSYSTNFAFSTNLCTPSRLSPSGKWILISPFCVCLWYFM